MIKNQLVEKSRSQKEETGTIQLAISLFIKGKLDGKS
jgi:hypothetical protein